MSAKADRQQRRARQLARELRAVAPVPGLLARLGHWDARRWRSEPPELRHRRD